MNSFPRSLIRMAGVLGVLGSGALVACSTPQSRHENFEQSVKPVAAGGLIHHPSGIVLPAEIQGLRLQAALGEKNSDCDLFVPYQAPSGTACPIEIGIQERWSVDQVMFKGGHRVTLGELMPQDRVEAIHQDLCLAQDAWKLVKNVSEEPGILPIESRWLSFKKKRHEKQKRQVAVAIQGKYLVMAATDCAGSGSVEEAQATLKSFLQGLAWDTAKADVTGEVSESDDAPGASKESPKENKTTR